jgi:hypothetical protein
MKKLILAVAVTAAFTSSIVQAQEALALIGTDTNAYTSPAPDGKNLGKNALVLSVSKTF